MALITIPSYKSITLYIEYPYINTGGDEILELITKINENGYLEGLTEGRISFLLNNNIINYIKNLINKYPETKNKSELTSIFWKVNQNEYPEIDNLNIELLEQQNYPINSYLKTDNFKKHDGDIKEVLNWYNQNGYDFENYEDNPDYNFFQSSLMLNKNYPYFIEGYNKNNNEKYNSFKNISKLIEENFKKFELFYKIYNFYRGKFNNQTLKGKYKNSFYSAKTNTIYKPKIFIHIPIKSSLDGSQIERKTDYNKPIIYSVLNKKEKTKKGDILKLKVYGEYKNVIKGIEDHLIYNQKSLILENTYYGLKDEKTNDWIITPGLGTKLYSDDKGDNKFEIYTEGLETNRHYRVYLYNDFNYPFNDIYDNGRDENYSPFINIEEEIRTDYIFKLYE